MFSSRNCSSGLVKCSFDNCSLKLRRNRKLFGHSPKTLKKKVFQKKICSKRSSAHVKDNLKKHCLEVFAEVEKYAEIPNKNFFFLKTCFLLSNDPLETFVEFLTTQPIPFATEPDSFGSRHQKIKV